MLRITFAVFMLTVTAVAIGAAAVIEKSIPIDKPGFIYIGSTNNDVKGVFKTSNYWMSANSAGYAEARRDCRANGDALLQVDSSAEMDQIYEFLQDSDQSVSFLWVGGNFDSDRNTFSWENGGRILSGLWATGEPKLKKPNSRVAANTAGKTLKLVSKPNTQSYRYICEG